jgi:hypothetical protein
MAKTAASRGEIARLQRCAPLALQWACRHADRSALSAPTPFRQTAGTTPARRTTDNCGRHAHGGAGLSTKADPVHGQDATQEAVHGYLHQQGGMDDLFPLLPAHLEYMIALAHKGVLFAAGPVNTEKGAPTGSGMALSSTPRQRTRHGALRKATHYTRKDCAASKSTNGSSWKGP